MDPMRVADRSWPVLNQLMRGHAAIYRASGGRIGHHVPGAPPMLLLDHVGAKSGTRRTAALAYVSDGDDVVLVASKGGHPKHPAWFHNLRANPEVTLEVGTETFPARASVPDGEERQRLWDQMVAQMPGFADYQRNTTREIPVVVLERAD